MKVLRPPRRRRSLGFPRWPYVGWQGASSANGSLWTPLFAISKQIRPQTQVSNEGVIIKYKFTFTHVISTEADNWNAISVIIMSPYAIVDLLSINYLLCGFMYLTDKDYLRSLSQTRTWHTSKLVVILLKYRVIPIGVKYTVFLTVDGIVE